MKNTRPTQPARWRALLGLLWRAGRGRAAWFAFLVLLTGLIPTAIILVTGALVAAIPAAVEHGLGSPRAQPALWAMGALLGALAVAALAGNALALACRALDIDYALQVRRIMAGLTLGTPGLAELDDPALANRMQAVLDAEQRGVLRSTASAISTVVATRIRGIGAFVVLLSFSWWAPLLLAAAWYLSNVLFLRTSEKGVTVQMNDGAVQMRRAEYLRSVAVEPAAAKEVRVFGVGDWVVGRYGDAWREALGSMWRSRKANRPLTLAVGVALVVSHGVVLYAMAAAVGGGDLSAAGVLVLVQAVIASSDLGMIGDHQWYLVQTLAVADRVEELRARTQALPDAHPLPASAAADGRLALPAPSSNGSTPLALAAPSTNGSTPPAPAAAGRHGKVALSLQGVRFTYRGRDEPTLDGLDLEVPAGQSLAIVGENGAGKSTLIKLLCGLYEPDAGRVALDGGVSPLQARGRIGVIFQDFVRYKLPLRENVGFGSLPLMRDTAALEGALRDAGGADLFAKLPGGWDTVLSREYDGGADLSGGQWQRVALARALTAVRGGAGLLILDEPTAALDVRAETELFERFLELTRDVTTILVSHRLSSVRRADRIVVIEGGRVVEDGTHDALMAAGGRYARMYSLQAERFAADAATPAAEVLDA
jgi:ATP-binding cassette subfamily B protein